MVFREYPRTIAKAYGLDAANHVEISIKSHVTEQQDIAQVDS